MDEATLQEKLRRIEALHAGTTSDAEREAARGAAERIRARLAQARSIASGRCSRVDSTRLDATIDDAAKELRLSTRSLQRSLGNQGTSFHQEAPESDAALLTS